MIRIEPRGQRSKLMTYGSPVLAVVLTLVTGMIIFAALGQPPVNALYTFFVSPLTTSYGLSELLVKACPLVLIGVGLSIAAFSCL